MELCLNVIYVTIQTSGSPHTIYIEEKNMGIYLALRPRELKVKIPFMIMGNLLIINLEKVKIKKKKGQKLRQLQSHVKYVVKFGKVDMT